MELAIDHTSNIEDPHRVVALQAVAGNSVGVELAFRFIRTNLATIVRRYVKKNGIIYKTDYTK